MRRTLWDEAHATKEKFTDLDLNDLLIETPFERFFKRSTLNFSLVLIHALLLRKVNSKIWGEIQFGLG